MAAPTPIGRQTPATPPLTDGYQTLIAFNNAPNASVWERTVKPPGIDGGDAIDTTTMHNTTMRTMQPRALFTLTDITTTVGYDPAFYNEALTLINDPTIITVHFPNGDRLAFYGFLKSFEPSEHSEGSYPEATITIVPTNQDPDTLEEEPPVLVQA